MVSFYHAKHGIRSLGASPFHEAVGQALKNLGRMTLAAAAMPAKYASWAGTYRNAGTPTAISLLTRGATQAEIKAETGASREAPTHAKRVYLLPSSLRRPELP